MRDTGIGIPADKANLLFKAFSQVDASMARKFGGTGLGLAISKGLVKQMGGSIGMESVHGTGSTFWFTMPFLKQRADAYPSAEPLPDSGIVLKEKPGAAVQKHEQGKRLRILVAEDNMANQMVVLGILKKMGHIANAVADGNEAVKALETIPYDLVLMDIQMPEMDGLEATAVIRDATSPVNNHAIPILALAAHTMPEDRQKCLAAGMNGYITKPVSTKSVTDAIASISFANATDQLHTRDHGLQRRHSRPVSKHGINSSGHPAFPPVADGFPIKPGMTENVQPPAAVFDSQAFAERLSGDSALIREVVNVFLEETPQRMRELENSIKNQQKDEAARLAHTIKGSAANIGGNQLRAVAARVEKACNSADWHEAEALTPRLNKQFEFLERAIRDFVNHAKGTLKPINSLN